MLAAGQTCQPPLVFRSQRQRAGEHLLIRVEEDELGPGEPAHLPQHGFGEREASFRERGDDAAQAFFLRLPLPHGAEIAARSAGQRDRQDHDGERGHEQLDLDRPAHGVCFLPSTLPSAWG